MSIPLLWYRLLIILLNFHIIYCAPKLGGIMFEPILFEAFSLKGNTSIPAHNKTSNKNEPVNSVGVLKMNITITDPKGAVNPETSTERTIFISEIRVQADNSTINITNDNFTRTTPRHRIQQVVTPSVPLLESRKNSVANVIAPGIKKMLLYKTVSGKSRRKSYLRNTDPVNKTNTARNNQGYNFDDTICRIVEDRVLCGYNLNPQPPQTTEAVELANGCRQRGDRVECGYVHPPFANSLRNSAHNKLDTQVNKPAVNDDGHDSNLTTTQDSSSQTRKSETQREASVTQGSDAEDTSMTKNSKFNTLGISRNGLDTTEMTGAKNQTEPSNTKVTPSDSKSSKQQYCVEKGDRIICYEVDIQM